MSGADAPEVRTPRNDGELREWLQNMVWHHRFTTAEITAATGLSAGEVEAALERFAITPANKPKRPPGSPLLVLPYPGGRHPRIGFRDGAVRPQRETKFSVFTPWDENSYVVVDLPEAIWSNLGLLYLAHTHVPTVWSKQGIALERLEWERLGDGLRSRRTLPNGVVFGASVTPTADAVRMELWLTNGSTERLSDLRLQMCVLLKGAAGFQQQSNDNKVFWGPYVACRSADGRRWIITAWEPCQRGWANPPCPCLHSDPKLPDCAPGQTHRVRGWLSFYIGTDLDAELRRIDQTGWRNDAQQTSRLHGAVVDADTGKPLPARVYVQSDSGTWYGVRSAAPDGSAVAYRKQRPNLLKSVEMNTSLSAHPFLVELPPGRYAVTVERGKEYLSQTQQVTVGREPVQVEFKLKRWINLAERGWYSGDTHVHLPLEDLPNVMLAEDLNVAFPLTSWVTEAFASPRTHSRGPRAPGEARLISVDATHVIYPRNTEYEIFTVGGKPHTLGAFFVLNHQSVLDEGVPPVGPVGARARREGALIEMDKHNWPWSMMLVPVLPVDLYELANNHVWRTAFGFPAFGEAPAAYMQVERTAEGFTERGWLEYGFQNYYALLNCGFRLRPTAGTAAGVHPVPLGFGRVYVQLPQGFRYDAWVNGLNQGRSFVSTGPMLFVEADGQAPGHVFKQQQAGPRIYKVHGTAHSGQPLRHLQVVVNGAVVRNVMPANRAAAGGGYESAFDEPIPIDGSSWIVVRCFEETPDQRPRFAHSGPVHVEVPGQPLRPRRVEVEYLIQRVEQQLKRCEGVLPPAALEEYRMALRTYQDLARMAR